MQIQRLRNLTTGILHTKIDDIYEDIEFLTGEKGIMTHILPRACKVLLPFLQKQVKKIANTTDCEVICSKTYDPNHHGEIEIRPLNDDEKKIFWENYSKNITTI